MKNRGLAFVIILYALFTIVALKHQGTKMLLKGKFNRVSSKN